MPSGAWDSRYTGTACDGFRGLSDRKIEGNYDDVAPGAQVVVKDESGKTIAVTTLDAGTIAQSSAGDTMVCRSTFALKGLPVADFYSIHIGDSTRSDAQFTKSDMRAGPQIDLR